MKTQIYTYHRAILFLVLIGLSKLALSDGLLLPVNENYPADFLRIKLTDVNVKKLTDWSLKQLFIRNLLTNGIRLLMLFTIFRFHLMHAPPNYYTREMIPHFAPF